MLNSLYGILSQSTVDYHLQKIKMPLNKLMNELHSLKSSLNGKDSDAYAVIGSSSDSKLKHSFGNKRKRARMK